MGGVVGVVRTGLKKCRVVNILAQTMNEQCLLPYSPTQALPYTSAPLLPTPSFLEIHARASIHAPMLPDMI